jgi:predicted RNase H-like HicB family nuclease
MMEVIVEFKLPARIRKKGKWFISSCPPLDVHSEGHTKTEAERNLVDALESFFVSCYERGTLDAVLRDAGFIPAVKSRTTKSRTSNGGMSVNVPVPFAIARRARRAAVSA